MSEPSVPATPEPGAAPVLQILEVGADPAAGAELFAAALADLEAGDTDAVVLVQDADGDGDPDLAAVATPFDADGDGAADGTLLQAVADTDGDGAPDTALTALRVDTDGDGVADTEMILVEGGADAGTVEYAALDGESPYAAEPGDDAELDAELDAVRADATAPDPGFAGLGMEDAFPTAASPGYSQPTAEPVPASAAEPNPEDLHNAAAAHEAQQQADAFVEAGNYAAAAEAREAAEDFAWQAGDGSMLQGSDSTDLSSAAWHQELAEDHRADQAAAARAGDYEAARTAAANVAWETGHADFYAGGSDHTGQADAQHAALEMAVWQEGRAEGAAADAAWYAEQGNLDRAAQLAGDAADFQASADEYGAMGNPDSAAAAFDPSSQVDTDGDYSSSTESSYSSSAGGDTADYDS